MMDSVRDDEDVQVVDPTDLSAPPDCALASTTTRPIKGASVQRDDETPVATSRTKSKEKQEDAPIPSRVKTKPLPQGPQQVTVHLDEIDGAVAFLELVIRLIKERGKVTLTVE